MHRNQSLFLYMEEHAKDISNEWFDNIEDSDATSVYASKNSHIVKILREQNLDFVLHFNRLFIEEKSQFFKTFDEWIVMIASDPEHMKTPIPNIIREFIRVRDIFLKYVRNFIDENKEKIEQSIVDLWNEMIIKAFDVAIHRFAEEAYKLSNRQLVAQQEMINELSSPVISLKDDRALLPLIGDIDTARAKMILENTLTQCGEKGVKHLYIDLSGVVMIDTMVAHQIFQLLKALDLIGVESTISGIRPEIAQTAVQLGLSFERVTIKSTLANALSTTKI
ncbi:STAS domain-containing protein [Neobacillus terrae]|uniref:STAS domain-containing protein n=1 Tax=Neobacillus terrae TaxID=3034837 RepID=UPI00140C6991|nr:STAS domain-containing protein [Neobacillus terrae]NHM31102.1 STAS domain-containing protein [Neobacillus terrae]